MTRLAVSFITHAMPRLLSLTKPSAPISRRPPRPICNNNYHGRNMTSQSSDGLFVGYPEFTEEGFKAIDDANAQAYERTNSEDIRPVEADKTEESFQSEIDGLNLNNLTDEDWAKLDNGLKDVGETTGEESSKHLEASFASEIDGLNMGTLTEDEFAILDAAVYNSLGEPSIRVGFEPSSVGGSPGPIRKRSAHTLKSPLGSFRRNNILSVTDLTAPVWCEVQFDYGLRGQRSRPIDKRPTSFKSSTGKVIVVEQHVAKRNDIRTKQGLSVHKELQREIRVEELKVDITTKETQWALRIVNSLACLKELLHGPRHMTREMPVFGILHDQVVVGIIDEVEEVYRSVSSQSGQRKRTRGNAPVSGAPPLKRTASAVGQPDRVSLNDRENTDGAPESLDKPSRFLQVRDAKTRKNNWMPSEHDSLSGRLQLYMYRTLLRDLIAHDPPFNFDRLWKKLCVNPDTKLPTKFLVQAQLIRASDDFETVSLNDLAASFHQMVMSENLQVNRLLELVYYQRPPAAEEGKGKGKEVKTSIDQIVASRRGVENQEDADLAQAIAMSLESSVSNEPGPSRQAAKPTTSDILPATVDESGEDVELANVIARSLETPVLIDDSKSEGIRRFPLIGRQTFFYDPHDMNSHISRILEWWRGERQPEGVPVEFAHRCRSCEYANNCEWRIAKASESSKKG